VPKKLGLSRWSAAPAADRGMSVRFSARRRLRRKGLLMFNSSTRGPGGRTSPAKAAASVTLIACLSSGVAAVAAMPASASITGSSTTRSLRATTVTLSTGFPDFSGRVRSTRRGCVNNRRVAVIKQVGNRGGGDDRVFGHDRAAADGRWKVVNPGVEGKIYARVRATSTCAADTSRTVRFMRADRG
jgi:hypothetical protein